MKANITINDFPSSDALKEHIQSKVDKLTRFCDDMVSCEVSVGKEQNKQHQGKLFIVHVKVQVPGKLIVASDSKHAHEDVYIAFRDSYAAIESQLKSYVEKRRGDVKHHESDVSVADQLVAE